MLTSLDATQAADHDRIYAAGPFVRPATWAEQVLAVAHGRTDLSPDGPDPVPLDELTAVVRPWAFGRRVRLEHELLPDFDPDAYHPPTLTPEKENPA